ncbi:MAG: hypothetical protein CM1200mP34_2030 [Verrucomicrobiales bacterium]|nr:MAG: hypothetical protein CM1200mP34_2030 [Verrucomicrobiales bacterium]
MNDINQSVFVRIPFKVSAADQKIQLHGAQYEVRRWLRCLSQRHPHASANAASNPAWNAGATGQHDDASAVTWVSFDAEAHKKLKTGTTFSHHGLNSGLGSSDMLINAELSLGQRTGAEIAEGVLKYTSPIRVSGDTTIRARTMHNGQWSAWSGIRFRPGVPGRRCASPRSCTTHPAAASTSLSSSTTAAH